MADPTTLTLSLTNWSIYFSIIVFSFFYGLGSETAKYFFEKLLKKKLDKVSIEVSKDGIEVTTKKTLRQVGENKIFREEDD